MFVKYVEQCSLGNPGAEAANPEGGTQLHQLILHHSSVKATGLSVMLAQHAGESTHLPCAQTMEP